MVVIIEQEALEENYFEVIRRYNDLGWGLIYTRCIMNHYVLLKLSWLSDLPPEFPDLSDLDLPSPVFLK